MGQDGGGRDFVWCGASRNKPAPPNAPSVWHPPTDIHHSHLSRNCGSVGAESMLFLLCSFIHPDSTTPADDYMLTFSSIRTPLCGRGLRANGRI